MKRIIPITICLVAVILTATSCFRNDLSHCPPEGRTVRVYFNVKAQQQADRATTDEIDHMSLFIFDSQNKLVTVLKDDQCQLSDSYYMTLLLDPGSYTFASWANLKDCYQYTEYEVGTDLNLFEVYLKKDLDNNVLNTPHSLFSGYRSQVVITEEENQTVNLTIQKLNNIIHVRTEGYTPQEANYRIVLSARNGIYKLDSSFASDTEQIHYISPCTKQSDGQLSGSLTTMRFAQNRKYPVLKLENTDSGETVYEANMIDLIIQLQEKDPTINIDEANVYDIVLRFDAYMNVSVSLNGWELVNNETEV